MVPVLCWANGGDELPAARHSACSICVGRYFAPDSETIIFDGRPAQAEVPVALGSRKSSCPAVRTGVPRARGPESHLPPLVHQLAFGEESWELPIPATFIVERDGRIAFAAADPDYTERPEPLDIVEQLSLLNRCG